MLTSAHLQIFRVVSSLGILVLTSDSCSRRRAGSSNGQNNVEVYERICDPTKPSCPIFDFLVLFAGKGGFAVGCDLSTVCSRLSSYNANIPLGFVLSG